MILLAHKLIIVFLLININECFGYDLQKEAACINCLNVSLFKASCNEGNDKCFWSNDTATISLDCYGSLYVSFWCNSQSGESGTGPINSNFITISSCTGKNYYLNTSSNNIFNSENKLIGIVSYLSGHLKIYDNSSLVSDAIVINNELSIRFIDYENELYLNAIIQPIIGTILSNANI